MKRLILLAALLVASCGSGTPPKIYRLAPIAGTGGQVLRAPVTLSAVRIPPELDRAELVRQSGRTELAVQSEERWAGPLADMIRDVLSQDLAARLDPGSVIPPDAPAAPDMRSIVVTIVEFGENEGQQVRLAGDWALLADGARTPALRRHFDLTVPASAPGGAGQTEAMSKALGQLSDALSSALGEGTEPEAAAPPPPRR